MQSLIKDILRRFYISPIHNCFAPTLPSLSLYKYMNTFIPRQGSNILTEQLKKIPLDNGRVNQTQWIHRRPC